MTHHQTQFARCLHHHADALASYRATKDSFWLRTVQCYAMACVTWLAHERRDAIRTRRARYGGTIPVAELVLPERLDP